MGMKMNEQDAIAQMVAPGTKRPHIWRNGVMQIWLTRACDLGCFGCTQGSNLAGKPGRITVEQVEQVAQSLEGYFGVVGVFGGNPALHPQFAEICEVLKKYFPQEQLGLWCNHPRGKCEIMRSTFNVKHSNLNVHLVREAYDEFARDWPECKPYLKGLDPLWSEARALLKRDKRDYEHRVGDARHSPPFVAMSDLDELIFPDGSRRPNTEDNRWELIASCDINRNWSALYGVFRGEVRFWFCEIAAAQAMLCQHKPDYPDTGLPVTKGVWNQAMQAYAGQVRQHCHNCGIPNRGYGELAMGGHREQVSQQYADIYKPKATGRPVELVQLVDQLGEKHLTQITDYIENGER